MVAMRIAPSGIRDPQGMREGHGIGARGGEHIYIYIYMYIVRELPPQHVPGRPCFETFLELGARVVLYMFFGE